MTISKATRHPRDKYFRWYLTHNYNRRAEFYLGWMERIGFRLDIANRSFSLHLLFLALYITPWGDDMDFDPNDKGNAWGIEVSKDHLAYIHLGSLVKFIGWPWAMTWIYTRELKPQSVDLMVMTPKQIRRLPADAWLWDRERSVPLRILRWFLRTFDMKYPKFLKRPFVSQESKVLWYQVLPYQYTLESKEVQNRVATLHITERGWTPWFLSFLPLVTFRRLVVDVDFNEEVGEKSGSWKGGVMGTGFDLQKGQSVRQGFEQFSRKKF